jgi:hypothetical protein
MQRITDPLLDRPIEGLRLSGRSLRDNLDSTGPTLLVFLRHFGCIFCREMVRDVRKASSVAGYPPVIFFAQADPEQARRFFEKHAPEARVVCDPAKSFYDALELKHGSMTEMFGPRVWACAMRAMAKGNSVGVGSVIGDPWTMPGVFLVEGDGSATWQHHFAHAGDHPDWSSIPAKVRATVA